MTYVDDVLFRLRCRLRPLRRTTVAGPLIDAFLLRGVLRRLEPRARSARVLGCEELAPYVRELTVLSPHRDLPDDLTFDYIVARQDHINGLSARLVATLRSSYRCTYANRQFALFAAPEASPESSAAVSAVTERIAALTDPAPDARTPATHAPCSDIAILMTTFNRPAALRRSLPQVARLGCAVLVVDDGTTGRLADENAAICLEQQAQYLRLPQNRGLCAALNIGLAFVLADRRVEWISYFQDDVDVDPSVMDALRRVGDALARPVLTAYDADEHAAEREETIHGIRVRLKRSSTAVHLHAHASYWKGVLPIPTEYLGAPRRRWEGSLEDPWILNHAEGSAGRRGLAIPCVPGLVRTFLWHHADSTWGNPNQPDPPLATMPTRCARGQSRMEP